MWSWLAKTNIWCDRAGQSRVVSHICKPAAEFAASRASFSQSPQSALIWAADGPEYQLCRQMNARGSRSCESTVMEKMSATKALERRIMQMYIWLLVAPEQSGGQRIASLARHGAFEVRLIELPQNPHSDCIPLWIELFDHRSNTTLDSYAGCDFEDTALAAAALISQARDLHRNSTGDRPANGKRQCLGHLN
jgi:hypothetical protein